jgi:rhomboid protease GluP
MLGPRGRRALNHLLTIAVLNLVIGMSPQIDNWGHLGGLVGGILFAWFAGPVIELDQYAAAPALVDSRPEGHYIGTAVWVTGLFTLLALGTILVRLGIF